MSHPPDQRPPEHRVDQFCNSCNQYDKHPRHIYVVSFSEVVYKHFDCCAADGCPNGHCTEVLADSGNAHGEELIRFLAARNSTAAVTNG